MKKIVALVLSLVMVLGLATTAFAATNSYEGLYAQGTYAKDAKYYSDVTVEYFKAVAPKDTTKPADGVLDVPGTVAYYTMTKVTSSKLVEVATAADADFIVYTDAEGKAPYLYLAKIEDVSYFPGAVTTNFGTACGQYTNDETVYDDELTYYVSQNTLYYGVEDYAGTKIMVDGKLVDVAAANGITKNAHKAVFTKNDKGVLTSVKCSACGCVAAKAANYATLPVKAVMVDENVAPLWYWTTATDAPAAGETVESAKTFDAGIAMYVGMSVMAAAGSAVVLKKKD